MRNIQGTELYDLDQQDIYYQKPNVGFMEKVDLFILVQGLAERLAVTMRSREHPQLQ